MGEGITNTIKIQMFSGLAITYDGKNVSIGKNKTAKYIQLLEIVWLSGDLGIPKEQLTNILYDREEQSNLSNSFNNSQFSFSCINKKERYDTDYCH